MATPRATGFIMLRIDETPHKQLRAINLYRALHSPILLWRQKKNYFAVAGNLKPVYDRLLLHRLRFGLRHDGFHLEIFDETKWDFYGCFPMAGGCFHHEFSFTLISQKPLV